MSMLRHRRASRDGSRANRNAIAGICSTNNDRSQRSRSDGINSNSPLSQNNDVSSTQPPSRQRGRKRRATTELGVPPRGRKVGLKPEGDMQFIYADPTSKHYKYTMQLGIILKREHPGIIEQKEGDVVIKCRPALEWSDYYDEDTLDDKGQTAADRVKQLFWNLFEVHVEDDEEDPYKVEDDADHVLENYAMKKVRDMMYQLRVDAVKFYYEKHGERLDDTLACSKELEYDQYLEGRIPWFKEHAWPHLCAYWCSKKFKSLRKKGQESRFKNLDIAQNRGGSLPFAEARQVLAKKYGPEKATRLNTYAAMKTGLKNWDGSGNIGSTLSGKDDYCALAKVAYPDDWEQREIDVQLLYESSGGIPHGRLAIADGAIKKADVISKAREKNLRPSISASHRRAVQQNEELKRHNEILQNKLDIHQQLILALYKELGKEQPADVLRQRASFQPHGTTNSSVDGSQTLDDNTGDCDSGGNGGGDNSGGNIGDQDINATNLRTNNITAGGGN